MDGAGWCGAGAVGSEGGVSGRLVQYSVVTSRRAVASRYPTLCKSAKGRAPRVWVASAKNGRVPIQGFLHYPFGFAQGPVEMTILCWGWQKIEDARQNGCH